MITWTKRLLLTCTILGLIATATVSLAVTHSKMVDHKPTRSYECAPFEA